jgi:two-component system alkaline phosphatase synthesis response regulator PhoP
MPETLVLLVDDYPDALEIWEWYLRERGYDVVSSGSGAEAVRLAKSAHPDVIVMDLDLPGLSGCEAARQIRAFPGTSNIPLIAATGFSHERQMAEARDAGFDRIVIKPCDPPTLVEEIEGVLATKARGI